MKVVTLNFNQEYSNYSGIANFGATLNGDMRPIPNVEDTWGGNIILNEDVTVELKNGDAVVDSTVLPAGEYLCQARKNQFVAGKHVDGANVQFSISWKPGQENFLISLLPGVPTGQRAKATFANVIDLVATF